MDAGADVITRETFGSALIMGEAALKLLGYEDAAGINWNQLVGPLHLFELTENI